MYWVIIFHRASSRGTCKEAPLPRRRHPWSYSAAQLPGEVHYSEIASTSSCTHCWQIPLWCSGKLFWNISTHDVRFAIYLWLHLHSSPEAPICSSAALMLPYHHCIASMHSLFCIAYVFCPCYLRVYSTSCFRLYMQVCYRLFSLLSRRSPTSLLQWKYIGP